MLKAIVDCLARLLYLLSDFLNLIDAWYLAVFPEVIKISLDSRQSNSGLLISLTFLVVDLVLFGDELEVLTDLIGDFQTFANFKIEIAKVNGAQIYVFADLLDLFIVVASVQSAILFHLRVSFVRSEPLFKSRCFFIDVDSSCLSLLQKFADLRHILFVFESYVVVVAIRQKLALIRLDRLFRRLNELNHSFGSVHFPEDVLNDGVVFQHRQNLQVVFMLAEKLLPEVKTVDA